MKKLMMIAAMVLMSTGAFAQEAGKMAVGATLTDLLDSDSRLGFGAKFQYGINENFRAEADFKLFPAKYHVSVWNPTLNVHYLFPIFDKFYVYGIGGLGLWGYSYSYEGYSDSSSIFTFKFGVGAEYYITDQFKGLVETYYQIAKKDGYNYTDPLISIGAAYCF